MTKPILIVGGYGVVGMQLARIIRARNPKLPILLAGRTLKKAEAAAKQIGYARGVLIDTNSLLPLEGVDEPLGAVIGVVNDPDSALMREAILRETPYIDITRWTERLKDAALLASTMDLKASVALSSSWMAGICALIAKKMAMNFSQIEEINTDILFRLNDNAGPDSIEYADRLSIPFRIWRGGKWQMAKPLTDPKQVIFPSGYEGKALRFDEPSQETLSLYTGAKSVSSRITYDDASTNKVMAFLVRSGLWSLISGPAFTKFRRSLIYNPGSGAAHEMVITVTGKDTENRKAHVQATIVDPKGQTHMTAVGAYIQLCEAVGLEGRSKREAGIFLPENLDTPDYAISLLHEHGIEVLFEEL